jgi:8-oxo-dGTP pyrophosphatase MutT (NUDIX family)
MAEKNPWTVVDQKLKYSNPWIDVVHHDVLIPGGNSGIYGMVHFKNIAIGIVAIDEEKNIYLVGQYRFPLKAYSWEIPEGGCLLGQEEPIDAAKRELEEEVGILAERWTQISMIHTSNSVCDEVGYIFLAEGLKQTTAKPEATELLTTKKLPLHSAVEMVMNSEITDAISIAGILQVARLQGI